MFGSGCQTHANVEFDRPKRNRLYVFCFSSSLYSIMFAVTGAPPPCDESPLVVDGAEKEWSGRTVRPVAGEIISAAQADP